MYFVVLTGQRGDAYPRVIDDEDAPATLALFESEREAEAAAEGNPLGAAYGFEVFEWSPR